MNHSVRRSLGVGLAIAVAVGVAGAAPAGQSDVSKARAATAKFHKLAHAKQAGYAELRDADGIACIDNPGVGAMGVHYVNGDLVAKGKPILRKPDVLVYDPGRHGQMRLVALEYVVFQEAWDAEHDDPPSLYGREFELVPEGNRYGLDPFYELHAWVWKKNPRGMFDDWNPRVSC
jgi:hypothetical protein